MNYRLPNLELKFVIDIAIEIAIEISFLYHSKLN